MRTKWVLMESEQGAEQPGSTAGGDAGLGDVNWDALDAEMAAIDEAADGEPAVAVTPAEEVVATPSTPAEQPKPAEAVPQGEQLPPVTPQAEPQVQPAVEEQPAVVNQPGYTRDQLRAQYGDQLAQRYALSEEDARALITEPEKILPKLAAQVHLDVVDSVIGAVMAQIPQIMQTVQKTQAVSQEAESEFFKAWPQLNDSKYRQAVYSAVATYRALNPKAPRSEVIRAAGLNTMISLRLPLPQELMQFEAPPASAGFRPAVPGAGVTPTPQPGASNPFVALSEEFLHDDHG